MMGGVLFLNDDGLANITNSTFTNNSALSANVFFLMNSFTDFSEFGDNLFLGNQY
jgi:hypothetical protein